jgi:hypothetical protein
MNQSSEIVRVTNLRSDPASSQVGPNSNKEALLERCRKLALEKVTGTPCPDSIEAHAAAFCEMIVGLNPELGE